MTTKATIFRVAVFEKFGGPLSKSIQLDSQGNPQSNSDDCRMTIGVAQNVSKTGLSAMADLISEFTSENALALGTIVGRECDDLMGITTKKYEAESDGAIARTKDNFSFAEGVAGLLLLDVDLKGIPDEVLMRIEAAGGVWELIADTVPALASAGIIRRASTSAGLLNSETGEVFEGSGGEHIYVAVKDAADIPRATKVLHQRLWLAGLGWILLGKVGQMLERSLVDQSVGSPERLVFEGPPVLAPPLEQYEKARKPVVQEGDVIDTRSALPDLTSQEKARLMALVGRKKNDLAPDARVLRYRHDDRLSEELSQTTGIPVDQARQQIARRHSGELLPLHPLSFDDRTLGDVTVREVLLDPERFVKKTLADPLEGISYGRNKAMVFQRPDGSLWINSFAHGGARYDLKSDADTVRAVLENSHDSADTGAFITMLSTAVLETGEQDALLREAKRALDVSIGDLRAMLDAARRRTRTPRDLTAAEDDNRLTLNAPAGTNELTPVVERIDAILAGVGSKIPPFRTLGHKLAQVVERPPSHLHQLGSEERSLPAPAQLTIETAGDAEATMMIEEHIRFVREDRSGNEMTVRLQIPFVRAYAGWANSLLPRVRGIATLPFVLPNGHLKMGRGLDPELGLIFAVDEQLVEALSSTAPASLDEAAAAYEWLKKKWLVDVDTDDAGYAIIVALALTVIERHLLPEFPAFFVVAAQRGSGKTTVLNMVSTALSGSMASATSWSFHEDERRKSVFSFLREGACLVAFDNIPRGSSLGCPIIERVLTSPELTDRVLGESRSETVPASTVITFTGNNITPKGDMASRSLIANLMADRPDPENRKFAHEDPIEWTKSKRTDVLARLYTILRVQRAMPERAKTRFKQWWQLIGHPVELVSGVDFEDLFRANDQRDEEAQGATEFIALMADYLGLDGERTREFSAAELNKLMDPQGVSYTQPPGTTRLDRDAVKCALEDASGRSFSEGKTTSRRVAKKLQSIEDRPVEVNGKLLCLKVARDHEGNRYWIEAVASE